MTQLRSQPARPSGLPVIYSRRQDTGEKSSQVEAAKGAPFFTAAQDPPAGTAVSSPDVEIPKVFKPITIRGLTMQNRIWVSPMCQYSAHEGFQTPWHSAHLGAFLTRGPGLTMLEATAVQANGRITPEDTGIWLDAHVEGLRRHVEFAHSQNAPIAIQLAHAGRKASTLAPWVPAPRTVAGSDVGGWPDDVVGPSAIPFSENGQYVTPRAMSLQEISQLRKDFATGVRRSVDAGFDVIELHFAHGYLVSSFLSPASNQRTDKYGGSFENRVRLALELVEDARAIMPEGMPLFVRISATEWLDTNPEYKGESWKIDESIMLAQLFAERGVDVLDVSSGGNNENQKIKGGPGYQAPFAKQIKKSVGDKILISTVGDVSDGKLAEELLVGGKGDEDTPLDLVAAGRMFLKNPGLVWAWADDLGVEIQASLQYGWGFKGRNGGKKGAHPSFARIMQGDA